MGKLVFGVALIAIGWHTKDINMVFKGAGEVVESVQQVPEGTQ